MAAVSERSRPEAESSRRDAAVTYGALLSSPGAARLMASALYARLPLGMASLAMLLLVRQSTGSIAAAGIAVGAYALGTGATAPLQGALVDRHGQLRVLLPSAALQSSLLVVLALACRSHAPAAVLVAVAALAGGALPPLSASARALWPQLLGDRRRLEAFYGLEAVAQEVIWLAGPLIVAAAVALANAEVAVLLCAVMSLTGTAVFCTAPASRAWRPRQDPRGRGGALASRPLRTMLCSIAMTGCAWGCLSVGVPALAVQLGSNGGAGLLLSLVSCGSLLGGLAYGRLNWSLPVERRYPILLGGIALCALPLALAGDLRTAAPLAILLGIGWAPAMSCQYAIVERLAPRGSTTEAFTWNTSAIVAGSAVGSALSGALASSVGAGLAFVSLSGFALAAATIAALAARPQASGAVGRSPAPVPTAAGD